MKTLFRWFLLPFLLTAGSLALAQIPPTQHSNGIAYLSGGVGEEETVAILSEAKQWPVLLELSQIENGRGIWIYGANIKILNSQKQVIFDARSDGPYMLINLEPGDYAIEASYQGAKQTRALSVKANASQKLSLFWK